MAKDRPVRHPFAAWTQGADSFLFFPGAGATPSCSLLNKVRAAGPPTPGRTRRRIRIAPDVLREDRGMRARQQGAAAVAERL